MRARAIESEPGLPGTPEYDQMRAEVLGRARGEPMVFVREPALAAMETLQPDVRGERERFDRGRPGARIGEAARRLRTRPEVLRQVLLREGYVYWANPHDALSLVRDVRLADLFAEPEIWLQRRTETHRLERVRAGKSVSYRYADGPAAGREAQLTYGDRLAVNRDALSQPLHRDFRGLALDLAFDRVRFVHRTESALLVELRFGTRFVRTVLASEGAALRLQCVVGPEQDRALVRSWVDAQARRQRALRAMEATVDRQVEEAFRFDRPRDEEGPDKDGLLRPLWFDAYRRGQTSFGHDGVGYAVYDRHGRAWPPEVCVDFVLDTYERTAGTWFSSPPEAPARVVGRLDFNAHGIKNRRGVLAFGDFAEDHPELFDARRFRGRERIPFEQRAEFFRFLLEHADEFAAGDVVAIHGMKRDNRIHQHAILIETVDPVTGFPHGLADQMKAPRRRTWEGIMAEAPKRSLLFRVRPKDAILGPMDPGPSP